MSKNWEKIAKEYEKEIEYLWRNLDSAIDHLSQNHSFYAKRLLEDSLSSSEKAVFEIRKFT